MSGATNDFMKPMTQENKPETPVTSPGTIGSALSVEDAISGWGSPQDRANVLSLECEKLQARLDECRKFRGLLIRRIANSETPPEDTVWLADRLADYVRMFFDAHPPIPDTIAVPLADYYSVRRSPNTEFRRVKPDSKTL